MHTEPNDATGAASRTRPTDVGEVNTGSRRHSEKRQRRSPTDWRLGGRAVSNWDRRVLAVSLGGATFAICGGLLVRNAWPAGSGSLSPWLTWLGLASAVVYAFTRGRPAGLLRFRPIDLVYAIGLGVGLRLLQGVVSGANSKTFPTPFSPARGEFLPWLSGEFIPAGVGGPVVEEMFFRAVVLVVIFQALRRSLGSLSAGATALLFSAGTFVLLHCAFAPVALDEGLMLFVLGSMSAALVLLTGRIWGAICLHIVYNVTFLLISMAGGLSA